MTLHHDETGTPPAPPDPIEQLVRIAGPREPVPGERLARLRVAAHAEWQARTRERRRRTQLAWSIAGLASAALLVLAVRAVSERREIDRATGQEIATVAHVRGAVTRVSQGDVEAASTAMTVGDEIRAGDRVSTSSNGWLAARLPNGSSLRLDRETRVRWVSATALALEEGTVYVGGAGRGSSAESARDATPPIEIHTTFGIVREIGTQFEVHVERTALRVRVRDGLVRVSEANTSHDVRSGSEMTLGGNGQVAWRSITPFGPDWAWVTTLAAPYQLEGGSLRAFLDWVTAETGLSVRFARRSDEQKASTMILHGSIEGLSPDQALDAVLPASGVDHELVDGELVIRGIADDTVR